MIVATAPEYSVEGERRGPRPCVRARVNNFNFRQHAPLFRDNLIRDHTRGEKQSTLVNISKYQGGAARPRATPGRDAENILFTPGILR